MSRLRRLVRARIRDGRNQQAHDEAIVSQWAPTITGMITASQALRVAAAMEEDDVQSRLSSLQNLKRSIWVMSGCWAREGRSSSAGGLRPADELAGDQRPRDIPRSTGSSWDYMRAYAAESSGPQSVVGGTGRVREMCSAARGDPKGVYAAGLSGGAYPVNSAEWFSQSTKAIDDVIALSALANQEAVKLAETSQRSSLQRCWSMAS